MSVRLFKLPFPALAILLIPAFIACQAPGPAVYYVDSATGDDNNNGRSPDEAWNSLEKVNAAVYKPGDKILLKAGTSYTGQLHPKGSGAPDAPIVVDSFGDGDKPLIAAEGRFHEALLLENQEFWEVNNLQLTNQGPTEEAFRYGVRVRSWDYGTMRHIHLKNLHVHDVNGSLVKRDPGEGHGITWENGGEHTNSDFDGLLIEGCHLERTDRNGISGYVSRPEGSERLLSTNVVIRRNLIEDTGGDAIKIWGCDGALVEYNVVRGARMRCQDYAAGIWPWDSDNTLIQFNEVSGVKGFKDGQAFDTDGGCSGTVFQYNYSHGNDGGFMLMCCGNNDTVIRYNISQNDKTRLFHMAGDIRDIDIYNNLFYIGKDIGAYLFLWTGGKNWPSDTRIRNNIFYVEGTGRNRRGLHRKKGDADDGTYITEPGFGDSRDIVFENNILYGSFEDIPAAWRAMIQDPRISKPGYGGDGFESLDGYKLLPNSPAIGAGVVMPNNGGWDFWGNKLPEEGPPSIGPHEKQSEVE